MPRNPDKARCTFPGCHNWAMHGQERCHAHRYAADPSLTYEDALPAQDAPLEQGAPGQRAPPDAAGPTLPPFDGEGVQPEPAAWAAGPDPSVLDEHIAALDERLRGLAAHVRRLDVQLEHDPALLPAYTRLLNLQGQLTSRLARLLRERQRIGQAEGDDLMKWVMNQALDEASKVLKVKL
jgi:hypothetical protein